MSRMYKKCVYIGMKCTKKECVDCPVGKSDDGRQGMLNEVCADYRSVLFSRHYNWATTILKALQREILDYNGTEWTVAELKEAMRPLISGSDWRRRRDRRKLRWDDLISSLHEIRSMSAPK